MHLCFIDESGTPPSPSAVNPRPWFVIAGVIIHEKHWHTVAEALRTLCESPAFAVNGEIKWRFFGSENADPQNPVRHLAQEARDDFRQRFFDILTSRPGIRVVCCATNIEDAYRHGHANGPEDIYHHTYRAVTGLFQSFLADTERRSGGRQMGIVVSDHRGRKQDELLRATHHRFLADTGFSSAHANFVETLFLTPSHHSVGIQFADMVAGAIGRAYNTGDTRYARLIKASFVRDDRGDIRRVGLARFPPIQEWGPPGGTPAP